jgi:cytochrome P450
MIPVFDQRAQVLIDKWESRLADSNSNELHVNLAHELFGVTLDIIGLVGFGHDFDMTRREEGNEYAQAFSNIILGVRDLFIWIMALRRLAPMLPLPVNRRREANMDVFRHLLFPIIAQKREEAEQRIESGTLFLETLFVRFQVSTVLRSVSPYLTDSIGFALSQGDNSSDKRTDLMDRLIEAYMRDSGSGKRPLNDSELISHVLTFAFAGHETTNTAMSWAIYALSFRPDIEHKLREEIESVMGDRQEITVQDVEKMEYMNCFSKEVLRLYPPAAITVREAVSDDVINGVKVPAGASVVIFPAVMHRLEQYWDKPDEFIPERWFDKTLNNNPAYIPFLSTSLCPRIAAANPYSD